MTLVISYIRWADPPFEIRYRSSRSTIETLIVCILLTLRCCLLQEVRHRPAMKIYCPFWQPYNMVYALQSSSVWPWGSITISYPTMNSVVIEWHKHGRLFHLECLLVEQACCNFGKSWVTGMVYPQTCLSNALYHYKYPECKGLKE